ncbi:MAG: GNAT family N-acetyltransferase [Sphingobacteriaceae bacterium]|nr:GNAT family N-acetyltransferase [Sphingobacteriaceae bacterium]
MIFEILGSEHQKAPFLCESEPLTRYLREQASQDMRKRLAVCFVACNADKEVLGYYTLSTASLGIGQIPEQYQRQLPKNYQAPVILLGLLARDLRTKGQGLGELLLLDALFRAYDLSQKSIGAMAVLVDPIDEKAAIFYASYGFEKLHDSSSMVLSMKTIGKLR